MRSIGDVPGWRRGGAHFAAEMTVAACRARGLLQVKGHCRKDPCRRTVVLDIEMLVAKGFGGTDLREIERWWRCAMMSGCGLSWEDGHYPDGVPLAAYVGHGHTMGVRCAACGKGRDYEIDELILLLKKRGAGGGNTSVLRVAEAIRGQCKSCGQRKWVAKLNWPVAPGAATNLFNRGSR
jgi:hypothetical protein